MAGRYDPTGPGRQRPALAVDGPEIGMRQRPPVDRDRAADTDHLPLTGSDDLDQGADPSGAEPPAEIAARRRLLQDGTARWADEDEITDGHGSIERYDPPQTERMARRRIEAKAAPSTADRQEGGEETADDQGEVWSSASGHCKTCPGFCARRSASACFMATAVRSCAASCCAVRIVGQADASCSR